MSDVIKENTELTNALKKRKRINNIKILIISGILIILFASVVLNIVLIFKVFKLEKRMDHLLTSNNYNIVDNRNI